MRTRTTLALRLGAVLLGAGMVLTMACSDDGDDEPGTASGNSSDTPKTISVKAVDYGFVGLPGGAVPVGTTLEMKNDSTKEIHELVALRLPDNETRAVKDLIHLSDAELGEIMTTEPAMVLIAPPTADSFAVVGNGSFSQPGRYAILCFIPVGADPAAFMEAAQGGGDGPPDVAGGPPHAFQGMIGEVIVK